MANYKNIIIIIDDSDFKREDIKNYIKDINPQAEIHEFKSYGGAMYGMRNNAKLYNILTEQPENCIIFLDMMFPAYDNGMIERDMGLQTLSELNRIDMKIDTFLISSDDIDEFDKITKDFTFVKGHIKVNLVYYMKDNFKAAITKPDIKA